MSTIENSASNWLNAELVLFPINQNNQHWLFGAFDPVLRRVIVCDSKRSYGQRCLKFLERFEKDFDKEFKDHGNQVWSYQDISSLVPYQIDGHRSVSIYRIFSKIGLANVSEGYWEKIYVCEKLSPTCSSTSAFDTGEKYVGEIL